MVPSGCRCGGVGVSEIDDIRHGGDSVRTRPFSPSPTDKEEDESRRLKETVTFSVCEVNECGLPIKRGDGYLFLLRVGRVALIISNRAIGNALAKPFFRVEMTMTALVHTHTIGGKETASCGFVHRLPVCVST